MDEYKQSSNLYEVFPNAAHPFQCRVQFRCLFLYVCHYLYSSCIEDTTLLLERQSITDFKLRKFKGPQIIFILLC
jgi:hypothetical protein